MQKQFPQITCKIVSAGLIIGCLTQSTMAQDSNQQAVQILERVQQEYEQSIEDIDNYTVITEEGKVRHEKAWDNDRPYFKIEFKEEKLDDLNAASASSSDDLFRPEIYSRLKNEAKFAGSEKVEDFNAYVLEIDELKNLVEDAEIEGEMKDIKLYIDADDWILRRMQFFADAKVEAGRSAKIKVVTEFKDIRNIEGMMIPFKTVSTVTGLSDMLSEDERRQVRKGMEQLEKQLEQMPSKQRQAAEQMMEQQIQQYRDIIEEDELEIVRQVKDVKVNTER